MAPEHADEIRRRMAEIRLVLASDAAHLVASAKQQTDWRYYVKRYPWVCAGAAIAVGYLIVPAAARKMVVSSGALATLGRRGGFLEVQGEKSAKNVLTGTLMPMLLRFASAQALSLAQDFLKRRTADKPAAADNPPQTYPFRSRG